MTNFYSAVHIFSFNSKLFISTYSGRMDDWHSEYQMIARCHINFAGATLVTGKFDERGQRVLK